MKKVSIIGATVLGNRGAEAMLSTTIGRIKERHADTEFYVYSYYPEEDRQLIDDRYITVHSATPLYLLSVLFPMSLLLGLSNLLRLRLMRSVMPKAVTDLVDSDILIDLAGVSFMDGRTVFLPFNILTIWPAMLVGTPVVKFAQGLGPFKEVATKITASLFLPRCDQIFARGEITEKFLEASFPDNTNYQPAGDVAFSHKKGDSISSENVEYSHEIQTRLIVIQSRHDDIIGVCPSSVVLSKSEKSGIDYIGVLVEMIKKILEEKRTSIFLFPNATREESVDRLRNNDLPVIKKIVNRLLEDNVDGNRLVYITKDINTDSIKSMIEYCDITVVSRFHAMIASLSLLTPVMVLGWSHKYLEVMRQFDMQEWVVDYQDQKTDLPEKVLEILEKKEESQKKIAQELPAVKQESFKQFEYIFSKVLV